MTDPELAAVHQWVQINEAGFPSIPSPVFTTGQGTPYLRAPGVVLIAQPRVHLSGIADFLNGFDPQLEFAQYLQDPTELPPGAQLCKTAGQLCYASFTPRRTWNAEADRYFQNLKASGHGSVLEHASYSFLLYGISRSVTHELVRHRAGCAYSQISQRYVSGKVLRFVERPEYVEDPQLHAWFERRIDAAAADYAALAEVLATRQKSGAELLNAEARTDLRKKVQQAARSLLPNETEAPMVMTANARAWRHIIEMRASPHAEVEIRALALRVYLCLATVDPLLFGDYRLIRLNDGTLGVETEHSKV